MLIDTNPHPRDNRLLFDAEKHSYHMDTGQKLLSVSQLIDRYFPTFDKEFWAAKKAPQLGMSPEEVAEMWEKKGLEAARLGTGLHESIENFYNHGEIPDQSCEWNTEFNYFLNFTDQFQKLEAYRTEWRVYDEHLGLAGTIDMVYDKGDGHFFLFDWKRSSKLVNKYGQPNMMSFNTGLKGLKHLGDSSLVRYGLQQNLYRTLLERNYGLKISSMNLLVLHPDLKNFHVLRIPEYSNEVDYLLSECEAQFKKI